MGVAPALQAVLAGYLSALREASQKFQENIRIAFEEDAA
jgi:hypothetical protein